MKKLTLAVAFVAALATGAAQAALIDRGGGLLYDSVLNVTWLQDANYARTSGYVADGLMNWTQATSWAAGLVYGGFDDWRLPSNSPVGADWNYDYRSDGTADYGNYITSPHHELSYMYYVNLGLQGVYITCTASLGCYYDSSRAGIFGDGTSVGQNDVGLVRNLQSGMYWSGTAPPGRSPFVFSTSTGAQTGLWEGYGFNAWAVRSGDVGAVAAPIPEPETYAMLLAGLGLLGLAARRRKLKEAAAA